MDVATGVRLAVAHLGAGTLVDEEDRRIGDLLFRACWEIPMPPGPAIKDNDQLIEGDATSPRTKHEVM